jgi:hypothetical protein
LMILLSNFENYSMIAYFDFWLSFCVYYMKRDDMIWYDMIG